MEVPAHRTWMYDRLLPGRRGYTTGFLKGVEEFIGFACRQKKYLTEGVIRCPCKLCKNEDHLTPDEVNVHIHQKGFTPGYWHWTSHGEELPRVNVDTNMDAPSSSSQQWGYEHVGRHQDMVFDAAGITHELSDEEEPPSMKAAEFYAILNSAQRPLYSGCQNASELSVTVEMLSIKSKHNMSQACFNDIMKFMKKSSRPENVIPPDFRQTKKLVGGLGLSKMKIDCCVMGVCCLHWKRMKEEKGTDPPLIDFYFRTHRKKDQSWVGVHAEAAYDKFEQKKNELSSQNSTVAPGEDGADSQPSIEMPSDLDIWVDTVGKKKGRVFGLGSVTKTLIPSSTSKTKKPDSEEVDDLRSQIHALNESLQRQFQRHEQEKIEMRHELTETRRQVTALMEHLGYAASSSRPPPSPQNYDNENEDDCDDFSDHLE